MFDEYKDSVIEGCKRIVAENLVKGTWGNVSVSDGERIFITPSNFPYEKLTRKDISVTDMKGQIMLSEHKPSSELKMHIALYNARKDIKAVIHTHPVFSSAVSLVCEKIPSLIEDSVMICGEEILVAQFASAGSEELAYNVVEAMGKNNAAIMKNHGLVTIGDSITEAITASLVCEKTAQIYIVALSCGNVSIISPEQATQLREKYLKHYKQ